MKRKKCRSVSSSAVPSSIEIIYQRSSNTTVEKLRIGAKVDEVDARPLSPFRSSQLAVITSLMSEYLTEYSRFPLTACCRNPAAHKRIECNAKRGETNSGKKMCEMNLPFRHLMFGYYVVSGGLHVCIVQTDRQSVIRDAVSLLCCCHDGSVGFCYGYDCVLPQTKIKSARGFYQFNAE